MHKDFLLEIGVEEMPARFIDDAQKQLEEKMRNFLSQKRIQFEQIVSFSTPRRLAILAKNVAVRQEDLNIKAKGPAKRIAMDEGGNWTKAAIGFARGQGADPKDLFLEEFKGEEYVFVQKFQPGEETVHVLPELSSVIASMNFPKNMRWGKEELRFVRPIRWLVALFGDQVIPMSLAGVQSDRITTGHRFLGDKIALNSPDEYEATLKEQYCIVNPAERRARILDQISQLSNEKGWHVPIDEDLLNEVVNLVEYPTMLYGTFDPSFLTIPRDVLITTMREHQRYFPVEDQNGKLLPYFITVRNGDDRNLSGVAKGNEKVLTARLADARFFYEEDQKLPIEDALKRLEHVVFHEELGTIADKVRRIRELAGEWAEMLKLDGEVVEDIDRTASICKFDLVTQMVYEFPELQGIMGEDYARKAGEKDEVARGIFEHHLPRYSGDILPASDVGALVSIADKIDTLVGFFSLSLIPTGSQDPYGLRRQAQGIVSILFERKYDLTLEQLFETGIKAYHKRQLIKRDENLIKSDLEQFFILRIKNLLSDRGIRYDVVDAVLSGQFGKVKDLVARADVLQKEVEKPEFKKTVEAFTRVNNLAGKAVIDQVDPSRFQESAESALWERVQAVYSEVSTAFHEERFDDALRSMASLQPAIEQFFDHVMVMVEDESIRNNRLAVLKKCSDLFRRFADFNKLVFQ